MESFCGSNRRTNVAAFACDQARKYPAKLTLGGRAFTPAECADPDTFKAAFIAAHELDTGDSNKLFTINSILDPNDTTEANKEGQVGEGPKQVLVEGRPGFTYKVEIGQDLFKRLRVFNKQTIPIFTYDDASNEWGVMDTDGNFAGGLALFFISGNTQQTSSAPVSALITISYLSARNYNDESFYVPVELGELEPAGLLDAVLTAKSHTTNVWKIDMKAPTAAFNQFINIAKKYNADIDATVFEAFTGATFSTSLALTSVAYDATLQCLTVTFDSTAYTALSAGAKIKLQGSGVADLVAVGVDGIEIVPVILTK